MAFESSAPIVTFKDLPESFPEDVEISKLGHGFNIIDGSPRAAPFTLITALYNKGKGVEEGFSHFKDFLEYERAATTMMGLTFQPGMMALDCGTRNSIIEDKDTGAPALPPMLSPFLTNIEKLEGTAYNFFGFEVEVFALTIVDFNNSRIANSKKLKAIENLDFSPSTKKQFYAIIDKYGTHYIHKARYGVKAEMRWMIKDLKEGKSALSLSDNQNTNHHLKSPSGAYWTQADEFNQKFREAAHKWKTDGFPALKDCEGPLEGSGSSSQLSYLQQVRCTPFLHTLLSQISRKKPIQLGKTPQMISYQAKELSELFTGKLAVQMKIAIAKYIAERKPLRLEDMDDGMVVWIRSMDNGRYVKCDSSGSLRCCEAPPLVGGSGSSTAAAAPPVASVPSLRSSSSSIMIPSDTQFQIRKKNDKIALKSVLYNRMVSRANTRPVFRFAYLPVSILGPHETFSVSGDYLLVHSHLHSPRFLYVAEDGLQILPDGSMHNKVRLCLFSHYEGAWEELSNDDLVEQETTENPSFPMKSPMVLELKRANTTALTSISEHPQPLSTPSNEQLKVPESISIPTITMNSPVSDITPTPTPTIVTSPPTTPSEKYPAHLAKRKAKFAHLVHKPSKFNSTSSLYIRDSINAPDLKVLSRCIAIAISYHVIAGHEVTEKKFFDIFDEEKHPLYAKKPKPSDFEDPPSVDIIFDFVNQIFTAMKLSAECGIMALAYFERVTKRTGVTVHARNWRRLVLCSFILASKVWEELAIWNVDFLSIFPNLSVKDLNTMEKQFLMYLQYNVSLKASLYTKYFFELQDLAESPREFPVKPMDKALLDSLEKRSAKTEDDARKLKSKKRAQSLDFHAADTSTSSTITNRAVLS
eukprot:TRINITY_DN2098_c0_g1_i1.p1 TRINITY_DN2098_c0_g1~~TRINITY_DN2098_c0_g1_i1.p1  ORF type:complete len:868 (-),score=205.54 TRINITY_DN2098_c0_g1_i1:137-2740(-)